MKVAIYTKIRENVGTAEAPRWENKIGSVYIIRNLNCVQAARVKEYGIPTLASMLSVSGRMYQEYVSTYEVVNEGIAVCDPWITPVELFYENGRWIARFTSTNGEYGHLQKYIVANEVEYELCENGMIRNYISTYVMRNEDRVPYQNLGAYFETLNY